MEQLAVPRCDYIPMWSSLERRCPRLAVVRVFKSHGGGESPVYRERCLMHADLGPNIVAFWDGETWRTRS